ncbi:MAG TPA: polysaccharide biosynthesis/export family protein [Tepidisphaeraceae bacterium]|jgi:protein involved in polysaccharide export with SLBB domain
MSSVLACMALFTLVCGCDGPGMNDFINPGEPKILSPGRPLVVPVLDTLASGIEEPDSAYSNATDIEPADLIPDISDYKIGPNDLVNISIFDLLGEGTGEQVKSVRVTETGMISLPFIPPVKASGLTERDLETAVSKAYEDARLIRNARVSVTVSEERGKVFSIQGNVGNPGTYQIVQPDFRMLDALVASRAPVQAIGVEYAYIIRKNPTPPTGTSPVNPDNGPPTTQPGDMLAPPSTTSPTIPPPQGRANPAVGSGRPMAMDNVSQAGASKIFKFDDVETPSDTRIIRVPIDQLRQYGELKYNVVIKPNDMIVIPDPQTGVYYMGGHVARMGVYSLSGQHVTLKQAWISAGGADDFAFPYRTEVVRRIGSNREVCVRINLGNILAMGEPDIYLKPNDVVYVGTHFIAPFLSALRNSFRLTYGAGFLYDRNYYNGINGF